MMTIRALLAAACLLAACSREAPQPAEPMVEAADHPGEAPYGQYCAHCHDQAVYKAPSRTFIGLMGAQNVLESMVDGLMAEQAAALDQDTRRAVAEYLTGQRLSDVVEPRSPPDCPGKPGFDPALESTTLGWGFDWENTRFQPLESGGLTAADVPQLEVKWGFAYPNAIRARSQPVYGGGNIYFGSDDGTVRALDAKTGCLQWTFKASAEVRTALVISPWEAGDSEADPVLYFGDILARAYAVKARTGELLWMTHVDVHPDATITGTPSLANGRLFVPVSSLEVVSAIDPDYACCTFRGSVVALDAVSGEQIWKTYSIEKEPAQAGTTRVETPILAPSGAPVWNSPTVDAKRGRIYFGTGENYSSPSDGNSDAIMALDMESGEKLWVSQQTGGDAWNAGCLSDYTDNDANCPEENGPDYDFAASPMLVELPGGGDVLIAGQKSGFVMAIDPDSGATLWKTQVGRGGVQGGIHFGMAADGTRVFVPINDMTYPEDATRYDHELPPMPGLYALDAESGELLWSSPTEDQCAGLADCDPGISQAIAAIPGAVIAGHMDGVLRIYASDTGEVLWSLNTLREFDTVSGEVARGGSFSGGGPIVADGMIYINSGYGMYQHMPGNVLLALGPADG